MTPSPLSAASPAASFSLSAVTPASPAIGAKENEIHAASSAAAKVLASAAYPATVRRRSALSTTPLAPTTPTQVATTQFSMPAPSLCASPMTAPQTPTPGDAGSLAAASTQEPPKSSTRELRELQRELATLRSSRAKAKPSSMQRWHIEQQMQQLTRRFDSLFGQARAHDETTATAQLEE